MWGPTQNLGPIGFAILRFIGYIRSEKQTDPDKQSIYIGLILKNDGFTNFKQKNNNNVDIDDNNNINNIDDNADINTNVNLPDNSWHWDD